MTSEQFETAFADESSFVEWKTGISRKQIQRAIVAFSNADGGVLMLGVDDDGRPTGKPLDAGLEKTLWEIINDVESPGPIEISPLSVGDTQITVLSIGRRSQGIAQTSDGTALIRKGKQNLPLIGTALAELASARAHVGFDSSPSPWSLADADPKLLARLCDALGIDSSLDEAHLAEMLEGRGLVVRRSGAMALTRAGALFAVPRAPTEFGKCFVEVFRFPSTDGEHDLRETFGGTPADQIDAAAAWIDKELGFDLVVVGRRRHELRRLPVRALREVIANAVAHRDYQLSGSAVEIRIYPHEVAVISPGGFVAPVTSQNLRHAHAARNRQIIRTLRAFGLAEDAGRGIRVIHEEMAADLRAEPTFAEDPAGHVTVRLPIDSPVTPEERAWVRELGERTAFQPEDRRVLIEAARGTGLSNTSVRSLLGVEGRTARQSLQRLREAGLLVQDGERRGTRYYIAPGLRRPAGVGLDRAGLQAAVLEMANSGPITNAAVRETMGLSRSEAVAVLRSMVTQGQLELRGSKRSSHYVLPGSR